MKLSKHLQHNAFMVPGIKALVKKIKLYLIDFMLPVENINKLVNRLAV